MRKHADPQVRDYEMMLVVAPTVTEEGLQQVVDRVSGYITAQNGTVDSTNSQNPWGRRRLAYQIQDHTDAFYVLYRFHATTEAIDEVERDLRLDDQVIRHLIARYDVLTEHEERPRGEGFRRGEPAPAPARVAQPAEAAPAAPPAEAAPAAATAPAAAAEVAEAAPASGVEVAEVHHDADGHDHGDHEWVVIRNGGDADVELEGWKLADNGEKHTYVFPAFALPAGGSVRVNMANGDDSAADLYVGQALRWWNDEGDCAYLYDASGTLVATHCYGNASPETA
ncbi:MAG TPA: 30S ribosomal protein S6 [Thermomicrobiales bacterium]|nr:30S ribosomal protein S6 [Thermomicrobiales bacterium]